jgi:hypothetical protein
MEDNKFLMDFKQDILTNVSKMLDDMEGVETKLNWMKFNKSKHSQPRSTRFDRSNQQRPMRHNSSKFCRLCHLARKPKDQVTSH